MSRQSDDPPGVTYEGENGVYTIRLHGRIVGTVYNRGSRHGEWTASPLGGIGTRWWTGHNRGEAVHPLIAWIEAGRP